MIIYINDKEVLHLTETQKKVIKHDIPESIFNADMKRRCEYWVNIPCKKFIHHYKNTIIERLKEKNLTSIPSNQEKLGLKFVEEYPSSHGYNDIKNEVVCKVGDLQFSITVDQQKIWRRVLEYKTETQTLKEQQDKERENFEGRVAFILTHKYDMCYKRLLLKWLPILEIRGYEELPIDKDELAELIFSQPDYKDREARDAV